MSSGLHFVEDYVDAGVSHVIEMLFGEGVDDHAAYAANFPLDHQPGTVWNYASGTTNIIARIVGGIVGGGQAGMEQFLQTRLFDPLGMISATPKFDTAGTFVGSSYVYATARDFAKFGQLYLRNGQWSDRQLLPLGWADHARTPISAPIADDEPHGYGAHWWLWNRGTSTFSANGYEGQRIIVSPERDLVVVRLGKSPSDLRAGYDGWLNNVLDCFPTSTQIPE
jgi:CubicO group peptidase (beta-lactamase class C family)